MDEERNMEKHKIINQSAGSMEENAISQSKVIRQEKDIPKPALPGVIYSEIVYWIMILSLAIAIPGFIIYLEHGGYLNSSEVLKSLWQGSDCHTIWKNAANISQPLPWYDSLRMLSNGDMLATLGIAIAGFAAVLGMWGAFVGTLRSPGKIYIVFALVIAIVLTMSALGIIKIQM